MKYFDRRNKRIVFIEKKADERFWDNQWSDDDFVRRVRSGTSTYYIKSVTSRYLPPGSKIIEGGCGNGQFVYALKKWGFDIHGVDFATNTIEKIHRYFPELQVKTADVRATGYNDKTFDGYWSLGVIEHFYEGFGPILKEMRRILKPGGFVFITFPSMSPLRKLKASLSLYPDFDESHIKLDDFYQFALNPADVIAQFEAHGFRLIKKMPDNGIKGLKDEVAFLKKPMQRLYNTKSFPLRVFRFGLDFILKRFSGHVTLMVFRKDAL